MQREKLIIFDTTLRDGEQCPGASLNIKEKLEIARQLALLKVDVIEAGFPVASPGDFESVKQIAEEIRGASIAGLSRALEKDIEATAKALEKAEKPRIHVFLSTSKVHRDHMVEKAKEEIIEMGVKAISFARKFCDDVEFSPMDATRTEKDFLVEVTREVIQAGATTVNIPDTVGYTIPEEFAQLIGYLKQNVDNIDQAIISVHCHNDLGLGVANSLAAVRAGVRQIECTINGIGERAGNASLEEIVMALKTRQEYFGFESDIVTEQLYPSSKLLSQITGVDVQPNKAIVGANAFAHEAGIHQHGVLKNPLTYEIMTPQSVGIKSSNLVMGKHSGRFALGQRIQELGFDLNDIDLNNIFKEFKRLADLKKQVFDEDIEALVTHGIGRKTDKFILKDLIVTSGTNAIPTATISMKIDDKVIKKAGFGDGPVDAALNTIKEITGIDCTLTSYVVKAITGGTDAQGEVSVGVEKDGVRITGRGAHTDIVVASALAFLNALNRLEIRTKGLSLATPSQKAALGGV